MMRLDREFLQHPHDLYRRLRDEAPVTPMVMWGDVPVWLVTRYAEAKALLNDSRLSKNHVRLASLFPSDIADAHTAPINAHMLLSDPPNHTRLRKLVVKAFTARSVDRQRHRITQMADDLLDHVDRLAADGPVDLIATYAAPLPLRVISEILGVPAAYRDAFRTAVELMLATTDDIQEHSNADRATGHLTELIAHKRNDPVEDLLTALVEASDDGDRLTESELLATTYLLVVAGYDTNGKSDCQRCPCVAAQSVATCRGASRAVEDSKRGRGAPAVRRPGQHRHDTVYDRTDPNPFSWSTCRIPSSVISP